jgi:hypothetical protein
MFFHSCLKSHPGTCGEGVKSNELTPIYPIITRCEYLDHQKISTSLVK